MTDDKVVKKEDNDSNDADMKDVEGMEESSEEIQKGDSEGVKSLESEKSLDNKEVDKQDTDEMTPVKGTPSSSAVMQRGTRGTNPRGPPGGPRGNGVGQYNPIWNQYMKHPLEHRWSLWWYRNIRGRAWEENLLPIMSFRTVEDFWSLMNYLESPSGLANGQDYMVFKHGIKPMWEDKENIDGGRWVVSLPGASRRDPAAAEVLDRLWLETLLCLIGEAFDEHSDCIRGAVVNVRLRGDKLAVWTSEARKAEANLRIAQRWKERMLLSPDWVLGYEAHRDQIVKCGQENMPAGGGQTRLLYTA